MDLRESVPGLPAAAAKEGLAPLAYMRKYGAFLIEEVSYGSHEKRFRRDGPEGRGDRSHEQGIITQRRDRDRGRDRWPSPASAFPRRRASSNLFADPEEWKWPEQSSSDYIKSHVHPDNIDRRSAARCCCCRRFRLPTLIHTRSGNAKWLYEISQSQSAVAASAGRGALRRDDRRTCSRSRPRSAILSTRYG